MAPVANDQGLPRFCDLRSSCIIMPIKKGWQYFSFRSELQCLLFGAWTFKLRFDETADSYKKLLEAEQIWGRLASNLGKDMSYCNVSWQSDAADALPQEVTGVQQH